MPELLLNKGRLSRTGDLSLDVEEICIGRAFDRSILSEMKASVKGFP